MAPDWSGACCNLWHDLQAEGCWEGDVSGREHVLGVRLGVEPPGGRGEGWVVPTGPKVGLCGLCGAEDCALITVLQGVQHVTLATI